MLSAICAWADGCTLPPRHGHGIVRRRGTSRPREPHNGTASPQLMIADVVMTDGRKPPRPPATDTSRVQPGALCRQREVRPVGLEVGEYDWLAGAVGRE